MSQTKLLPSNLEAEEAIIGCLLFDANSIFELSDLPQEAFYSKALQTVYECAIQLNKEDKIVDFMSISQRLSDLGILEKVGGMATLSRLMNSTVSTSNLDRYKLLVKDKYFRRELIRCGNEIAEIGYDQIAEAEEIQQLAEEKFFDLLNQERTKTSNFEHISEAMTEMLDRIDQERPPVAKTGIIDLDHKILGLFPKNLYIIAARPSVGKTWFSLNIAKNLADAGKNVAFLSAESSKEDISYRLVSMYSGVNSAKIKMNNLNDEERLAIANSIEQALGSGIYINDDPASSMTTNLVRSMLRKMVIKGAKPDVLILDYLQKLGKRSVANRAQVVGDLAGGFKDIAKEFNIPVVCLAQVNRDLKNRQDKRPLMSDLKDSGDIEQDADVIMMLYRDEYHNPDSPARGIMEVNVVKNRDGEIGIVKCIFDPAMGRVKNLMEFAEDVGRS